jgi:large subunit ribosomal protein L6
MMIEVPDGITIQVDGHKVTAKGPNGEVQKVFSKRASIKLEGSKLEVSANKALKGTIEAIVENMVTGVNEGFTRKLKVLYAHFPISIEVKGKDILIKNFLGERQPRKTALVGSTKVEVKGQNVTVSGPDKEAVGQTIANLKTSMKVKEKDGRIFQDGIYESE